MRAYQDLSTRGQVARIRPIAREMADQFGWSDAEMRLLNHGYNTTFALRKGDERAALRINVNSIRTKAQLLGEVAMVHALEESPVWVASPHPLVNGDGYLASLPFSKLHSRDARQGDMHALLYSWLPGRTAGHNWGAARARALGEATRQLHDHARTWQPPAGADFTEPGDVMIDCPLNPRARCDSFLEVIDRGNRVIERLRQSQPLIPIHFDLHMWNIKWTKGQLAVFDFDDCRRGWPAWDVAITLFYMRRFANPEQCEPAYWEGLGLTLDDLGIDRDELEALIAARGVFLASEMLGEWTADFAKHAETYVEVTQRRVQHYFDTGRFDPNVASLPN
ncbi:MAG: phosphotransferase [Methanoregulaceae archaeon]|nr:phosphotransferase [Methanoregulaceae archaeon]